MWCWTRPATHVIRCSKLGSWLEDCHFLAHLPCLHPPLEVSAGICPFGVSGNGTGIPVYPPITIGFRWALFSITPIASSCQKVNLFVPGKMSKRQCAPSVCKTSMLHDSKQRYLPSSSAMLHLTIYLSCKSAPDSYFKWGTDAVDNGLKAAKRRWRTKLTKRLETTKPSTPQQSELCTKAPGEQAWVKKIRKKTKSIYIIYIIHHHAAPAEWMSFISTTQLKNLQERLQ